MADFFGVDWNAVSTIIIAVTGSAAFIASFLAVKEMRKDRKVRFLSTGLEELYTYILEGVDGDSSIYQTRGILSAAAFYKIVSKEYLAGPKLKLELEKYIDLWDSKGARTSDPLWIQRTKEQGMNMIAVAKEERLDIIRELNDMVFH
jgi:hypothetical protein